MTRILPVAALIALAGAAPCAFAESADDVAALRAELQSLQNDYAARVGALEARIEQLESAACARNSRDARQPTPAGDARSAASAFNPAISLILAGNYTDVSQDPESWRIAGFMPSGGEVGPGARSFNVGESELALSASVDPYFTANMIASIAARTRSGSRRLTSVRPRCPPASPSRAGDSSPASATSTKCIRMPGISPTSRSSTRHSWAISWRRTACRSSGSRPPISLSRSGPKPATARHSRARGATAMA